MPRPFAVMSGNGVSTSTVTRLREPNWILHGALHAPEFASRIPWRSDPGPESALVEMTYVPAAALVAMMARGREIRIRFMLMVAITITILPRRLQDENRN